MKSRTKESRFHGYCGAVVSSWALAALVVGAELVKPFKDLLKAWFGHHWIGKLIIISVLFFAVGIFCRCSKKMLGNTCEEAAWKSVVWSLIVIAVFYVLHYLIAE